MTAASNEIYAQSFGDDLETEVTDLQPTSHGILSQGNIELVTTAASNAVNVGTANADEFEHFGKYVAAVMRNMPKYQSRLLQMDIMKVITEAECGNR